MWEWRFFEQGVVVELPEGAYVATDASGGELSADPRLRRIGFAVVVVGPDFSLLGALGGSVPGPQTVNRGELFAMLMAMVRTSGSAEAITDSAYVQRPLAEDGHTELGDLHVDFWELLL